MKIAFDFIATQKGSGTKSYIINFCNKINRINKKHELYIYLCESYLNDIDENLKKFPNIQFIIKPNYLNKSFFRILWMQLILPIELKLKKIKTLYSPMNISPIICKFLKIKNILTLHSNLPWKNFDLMPGSFLRNTIMKKLMELSIYNSDMLIVDSHFAKSEIQSFLKLNEKKIYVIYLGIDDRYFKYKESKKYLKNFNYKEDYLLSVISCVRYHNIINILRAYKYLISEIKHPPKICLIMQVLDKEYFLEIKNFIKKNFIENQIIILSNLENFYLDNIYANAKLYLFSSYCEVFGLTSLEAMSQKCPVLISNRSALKEINANAAEYFDPDKPIDLKNKIKYLLIDNQKRNKLIAAGLERCKFFKWDKNIEENIKLIESLY